MADPVRPDLRHLRLDLLIVAVNYALALAVIAWLDRRGIFGAPRLALKV